MQEHKIGVVAGVGPWAGLDLMRKLLQQWPAACDQAYPTIVSISQPSKIADRTAFLLGESACNPGYALAAQVLELTRMGATVVGIPCNTAHAPAIFDIIRSELATAGTPIKLLHMLEELAHHLRTEMPTVERVGLLATMGTYQSSVYETVLHSAELTVITPSQQQQAAIHDAIYNPQDGIKACGSGNARTLAVLTAVSRQLRRAGAEALILGCTELPLAITTPTFEQLPVVDPTSILAQALLREVAVDLNRDVCIVSADTRPNTM